MSITFYSAPPFPRDEAERERAVASSGLLELRDTRRLQAIVAAASAALCTAGAAFTVIYQDRQHVISAIGTEPGIYRRDTSFCGHAVFHDEEVFKVPDALADERFAGNPFVEQQDMVRFYAGAVIRSADGHVLGTLCVFDPQPKPYVAPDAISRLVELAAGILPAVYATDVPGEAALRA